MPHSLSKLFYQCLNYYGKYKHLARMKVVMVLAPGARDLKQTDKMAKPIRWIPPPTMYLKIFNFEKNIRNLNRYLKISCTKNFQRSRIAAS